MSLPIVLMLCAATLGAAEKKKAPAVPTKPPATATRVDARTYRDTDAQGRTWIWRQTPFGWSRVDEKVDATGSRAAQPAAPESAKPEIRASEDGEILRFEKPGPFGMYKWQRKKGEKLTADEQAAIEKLRTAASAERK